MEVVLVWLTCDFKEQCVCLLVDVTWEVTCGYTIGGTEYMRCYFKCFFDGGS